MDIDDLKTAAQREQLLTALHVLKKADPHILTDLLNAPHLQMFNQTYAAAVIRSAAQEVLADPSHPETWLPYRRLMELADELEGTKDWPACQHIVPTDNEIPTLISYERLDEVKLGDRIWQAYTNTKKEKRQ